MLKNKWALYLRVLRFELKMVDIGGNSEGDHRQYPFFRRTQNEAHRITERWQNHNLRFNLNAQPLIFLFRLLALTLSLQKLHFFLSRKK
jgi:hypothetical protein